RRLPASSCGERLRSLVSDVGSYRTSCGTARHAVEMAHEGVPIVVIQRQLGHANLGVTSVYLQGIDSSEIIDTVHSRPAPVISVWARGIGSAWRGVAL